MVISSACAVVPITKQAQVVHSITQMRAVVQHSTIIQIIYVGGVNTPWCLKWIETVQKTIVRVITHVNITIRVITQQKSIIVNIHSTAISIIQ